MWNEPSLHCPEWGKEDGGWGSGGSSLANGSLVLDLLKEFIGGILIAILLHLGEMALLRSDSSIHL